MQAWSKGEHLARMEQSGRFTWCHELVTASVIDGDATRFVALLRSQGDYQTIRMAGVSDAQIGFDRFEADVHAALGAGGWPMSFSYRVRIAIV